VYIIFPFEGTQNTFSKNAVAAIAKQILIIFAKECLSAYIPRTIEAHTLDIAEIMLRVDMKVSENPSSFV
jgi:hypothetical protein